METQIETKLRIVKSFFCPGFVVLLRNRKKLLNNKLVFKKIRIEKSFLSWSCRIIV